MVNKTDGSMSHIKDSFHTNVKTTPRYQIRCQEFVPKLQHDENPKLTCSKLPRKLEKFKDFIKQSASPLGNSHETSAEVSINNVDHINLMSVNDGIAHSIESPKSRRRQPPNISADVTHNYLRLNTVSKGTAINIMSMLNSEQSLETISNKKF